MNTLLCYAYAVFWLVDALNCSIYVSLIICQSMMHFWILACTLWLSWVFSKMFMVQYNPFFCWFVFCQDGLCICWLAPARRRMPCCWDWLYMSSNGMDVPHCWGMYLHIVKWDGVCLTLAYYFTIDGEGSCFICCLYGSNYASVVLEMLCLWII